MKKLLAFSLLLAVETIAADWQKLPPLPEPNGGFVCGEQDGKVLVVGGTNWRDDVKHFLMSAYAFDPQTMSWEKREPLADPIAYALSGSHAGKLVWAGGTNGSRSVRRFPAMPAEVVLSAGGVIGDEFVFVGGTDDTANLAGLTRGAFTVNVSTGVMAILPDFPGKPFGTAASATLGDELFVFGGANWNGEVANTDAAFAFSLKTRVWRKLRALPFAVRGLTAVALNDRLIYLAGGYKSDADGFSDEALIYDTTTDTYSPAPPLPRRAMVALVKCGDYIYCLGGEDRKKSRTDRCWRIRVAELLPR